MKKIMLLFTAAVLLSVMNVFYAMEDQNGGQGSYTMDLTVGTVEISHDGGVKWQAAEVDGVLNESDMIRTGMNSYCEIGFPDDKGCFRVQETSTVKLSKLGKETRLKITSGISIFDLFKPLFKDESFEVESETAVASVRGTQFFVESSKDSSIVTVEDGSVNVRRNVTVDLDQEFGKEFQDAVQVTAQSGQEVEFGKKDNEEFASQVKNLRGNRAELRKFLAGQREKMLKRAMKIKNRQKIAAMFREHRADLDKIKLRKKQMIKNRPQLQKRKAELRDIKKKSKIKKAVMNRKKILRSLRNR